MSYSLYKKILQVLQSLPNSTMTIAISQNSFWQVFFEAEQTKQRYDPLDEFDILSSVPHS
ncbi:MAG: hypothetical protein V7K29_28265 [Nostoc sp.]|uniref:hypothetical protein n=1 Tax=Nostoc sp. UHCC 0926 TaxID=3025190 RepID=UPI0023600972|nr:hypothetical protein [Nostoc sp. UHCC 0926]